MSKVIIKKEQVTRWHQESGPKLPEPQGDYFWHERVKTRISEDICMYGYQRSEEIGPGHYKTEWVTIKEGEQDGIRCPGAGDT